MERKQFNFTPEFVGICEGWYVNEMRRQKWRVGHEHDLDDLMQDGWLYFCKVADQYAAAVHDHKHFFALFRACIRNHFNVLANARTKRKEEQVETLPDRHYEPELDEFIRTLLEQAAGDVFHAMMLPRGRRETRSQMLKRLAGETSPSCADITSVVDNWCHS